MKPLLFSLHLNYTYHLELKQIFDCQHTLLCDYLQPKHLYLFLYIKFQKSVCSYIRTLVSTQHFQVFLQQYFQIWFLASYSKLNRIVKLTRNVNYIKFTH